MGAHARRILIVEDHPDGRESLRVLLELFGYRVDVAADGFQGIQKGLAEEPDVALVDIGLPHLDGYQVAAQLRAGLGRKVLLIAYTAYGQPEDRQRALEAGFDAHLVKPVDLVELFGWLGGVPPKPKIAKSPRPVSPEQRDSP
jgi:CheY-like chemotaxis protein